MPLIYLNEDSIVAASAALLLVTKRDDFMGGPTLGELVNIERALAELQQTTAAHTTPHEPPVPLSLADLRKLWQMRYYGDGTGSEAFRASVREEIACRTILQLKREVSRLQAELADLAAPDAACPADAVEGTGVAQVTPARWTEEQVSNALGRGQSVLRHKAIALCMRIIGHYEAWLGSRLPDEADAKVAA